MKKIGLLLALFIVCSEDDGLTRIFFEHVNHAYYTEACIVFNADHHDGPMAICNMNAQCVIEEGNAPPPGEPLEPKSQPVKK